MSDERETINRTNALIHIFLGGNCARCEKPAVKVIGSFAYCSDECEERISDFGLDDAEHAQHIYHSWDGMRLLLEVLGQKQFGVVLSTFPGGKALYVQLWTGSPVDQSEERLPPVTADALPLALAQATLKLIEQGGEGC